MRNNNFEELYFDYYDNSLSYVKTILDLLPNSKELERNKGIIKLLYNYVMNNANKCKKNEVLYLSTMFIDKISVLPKEEVDKQVDYLYNCFLKNMIYDSINRERFFDIMNECVKVFVGFYSESQVITVGYDGKAKIETGHYR